MATCTEQAKTALAPATAAVATVKAVDKPTFPEHIEDVRVGSDNKTVVVKYVRGKMLGKVTITKQKKRNQ
jgi:hypothetical protein